jgi:branched-subunit amino acid transport protein AzlD
MSRETFLSFRNYLWFWISLVITVGCAILYVLDDPIGGRNGSTTLGYSLGVLSTIGILYLMWYGIRKRSYYAKMTTLKAVLSSHIWIGLALVFIVPLHSGFSFGYNVHTITYILMLLTIATGVVGVFLFRIYPYALYSQRGGPDTGQLASTLYTLSNEIKEQVLPDGSQKSDAFMKMVHTLDTTLSTGLWNLLFSSRIHTLKEEEILPLLTAIPDHEQEDALLFIDLLHKKTELQLKIIKETRAHFLIRGWLFLHVPLSVALCFALFIHIFSVFYYW